METTGTSEVGTTRCRRRARRRALLAFALGLIAWPGVIHAGVLDLRWVAPTTNADGTPLLDLWAYRVYAGTSAPECPGSTFRQIAAPRPNPVAGETFAATLIGLTARTTYFVSVSAVDFSGEESACTPTVEAVARPVLDVAPAALDFGDVNLGAASTVDVTVQNLGPTFLVGTATATAPFSIVSRGVLSIPPGGRQIVRVRFAPVVVQTFVGNVNINTNEESGSRAVTGSGVTATPAVLQFSQKSYAVTEGRRAEITVTRTGGTHGGVSVDYAIGDGTASAGADYIAASGTLTFAANQMTQKLTVTTSQDTVGEGPETLTLTLSNPAGGAVLGAGSVATVTIIDDESSLKFGAPTYTAAETARVATITVRRVGRTAGTSTVDFATTDSGTATAGSGFMPVATTLTFAPGQVSRTITVPILRDHIVTGLKTVGLALSNVINGRLAMPSTATIMITESDVGGVIQFGAAAYTVDEAGGVFNVTVRRTGGAAANVTVNYAVTGGTATFGTDYVLPQGAASGPLTFGAGETSKVIPITLVNDTLLEGPRTIQLQLSAPGGGATLGAVRTAVVTIEEATFVFAPASYSVIEGATATVTVLRTGPVSRTATVDFTSVNGTAVDGTDFVGTSGTLTFLPGVRTRTFAVRTLPNFRADGARSVLLQLRVPTNAILGAQNIAVLTIGDDDKAGTLRFGAATYLVSERIPSVNIPVTRTGGTAANVTVQYAVTGGTATGGGLDYTLLDGTLTFSAGQTTATIPLAIVDDAAVEADETIVLELSNPTGGATLGTPASTTVTIIDDDRTSTVQFSAAAYTVSESAGAALIALTRTGTLTGQVTVDFGTSDGTATAGVDYTATNQTVTFESGQATRSVSVPVSGNTIANGARTVNLTLSDATGPAALGARSSAVLTIEDDDATLQFSVRPR